MSGTQITISAGIFTGTPGSYQNLIDELPAGWTINEIDSLYIVGNRAPIGFLQFFDVAIPTPLSGVPFWVPIADRVQVVNFQELGQPIPPFAPDVFTYAWSLQADTFDPLLAKLPTADLEILFTIRASGPS